ncbi:MAG: hypothetical protein QNL62_03895 [Gammaproteobacteria bacterium]|nr:hypothetical protein [Gammaproteobacteria bacterium]
MTFKSTHEILASIKGRIKPDLWQRITGILEFDPEKHSDGCSGGMSANYAKIYANLPQELRERFGEILPWRECCVVHDRAYYYGGTRAEKQAADEALKQCVGERLGGDLLGNLLGTTMGIAVSIGGLPYFKTSYRWGYGEDFRGTEDLPAHNVEET